MARLHEIMVGAAMHMQDHHGFYPMVGVLPGIQPQELDDSDSWKYAYFSYPFAGEQRMVTPITISLATELSAKQAQFVISNQAVGNAETDDKGFIRNFLCPAQTASTSEFIQNPMLYIMSASNGEIIWYNEQQSYIYNEAILGWGDFGAGGFHTTTNRLRGQANQVHQAVRTMFAADGQMGAIYESRFPYPTGEGMMSLYNKVGVPPVTMWDAYTSDGLAGDNQNFDLKRHQKKICVAFCDGHCSVLSIGQSDLSSVFLLAP